MWVKASGYVFNADEVIAVGPLEAGLDDRDNPTGGAPELRAKVVLRAGFEFELRGASARRFREMFIDGLAGGIHDHDGDGVQVNETRVIMPEEDPVSGPVGRPT
jgi:hypothetical protein